MKNNFHEGHRKRVKKRYINYGLDSFDDHQIIELLLFYCYPRKDTNEIAHKMLDVYGGLYNLLEAKPMDIMSKCGVSENVAVLVSLIPHIAKRYFERKWSSKEVLGNSKLIGEYCTSLFIGEKYECFYIICLDANCQLISSVLLSSGTIDSASVYPRNIIEVILQYKACMIALSHNHPSGVLKPSKADMDVTKRIMRALEFIDVHVVDHIIVAGENYFSFAENNLLRMVF